ncbi:MAG: thymidylate kinase [Candidatus Methanomethylophilaceae archaeon]|nr:thymidylate kinase [Candidatus Methanomethylophilaceae archaeon]
MTWYVVEGMDGSGKSSVAEMLESGLRAMGRRVMVITHPNTDTFVGRLERRSLTVDGKAALVVTTGLYITDVLHSISVMRFRGRRYDDIVFVRYIGAVAYLPDSVCVTAYDAIAKILPMPDVKLFVDVDAATAARRIIERGDEMEVFESEERLERTRGRLQRILSDWTVIDNTGTPEETRRRVSEILSDTAGPIREDDEVTADDT